jgi:hypothetical protein
MGIPIASGRPAAAQDLLICDYRFEELANGFRLFVRRKFGPQALMMFAVFGLFLSVGAWFISSFALSAFRNVRDRAHGVPVCCLPFVAAFVALWMSVPIRMMRDLVARLRGKELWICDNLLLRPPKQFQQPGEPLSTMANIRAGLCRAGKYPGIAITAGDKNLVIGPFVSEELARQCKDDLRQRCPHWFVEVDGTPAVVGLPPLTPIDTTTAKDPIESFELLDVTFGRLVFQFQRHRRGVPAGTKFLVVWLCGWAAGEIVVGCLLAADFARRIKSRQFFNSPPTGSGRHEPILFLSVWWTFWTFGGFIAMRQLMLRFRGRETWSFDSHEIVAGRSWRFTSPRRLQTDGPVHVRWNRSGGGPGLEFVGGGVSLYLGPFIDDATARGVAETIAGHRPRWQWSALELERDF